MNKNGHEIPITPSEIASSSVDVSSSNPHPPSSTLNHTISPKFPLTNTLETFPSTSTSTVGKSDYHSIRKETRSESFAREPKCGFCCRVFTLLRRRHHCRSCHMAVCKDCGMKAIDTRRGEHIRLQWYCFKCIREEDGIMEYNSGIRSQSKRMSISVSVPPLQHQSAKKFCIECGYELPKNVKVCIECGTSAQLPIRPGIQTDMEAAEITEKSAGKDEIAGNTDILDGEEEEKTLDPKGDEIEIREGVETGGDEGDVDGNGDDDDKALRGDGELGSLGEENERLKEKIKMLELKVEELKRSVVKDSTVKKEERMQESNMKQGVRVRDHPMYAKYFKLVSMGMPMEQVQERMKQSGIDPAKLEKGDEIVSESKDGMEVPVQEKMAQGDERYDKFFKLKRMGMPLEQIKLKMIAEGLDSNILDQNETLPPIAKSANAPETTEIPCDPDYAKFFKLLKLGMPIEQVKMKVSAAGLNPAILDSEQSAKASKNHTNAGISNGEIASKIATSAAPISTVIEPQLPRKEDVKPHVEMRSLFWSRVPVNVVSSTVWVKLNDANVTLDLTEMEWMFRKNAVDTIKKEDDTKKKKETTSIPQQVLLLDPKRQQNVAIAIARIKMSPTDIKNAILNIDTTLINSETLNVLIQIAPTLEEQDLLKNYNGDQALLGTQEKFFLEMMSIPRYTQRIKCMRFHLSFEDRVLETQAQLDILSAATDELIESRNFRKVLEHILAIGNYLNGGTPRGAAYGFKLDTLTKLHTLRSIDPKINLMHFLAHQLEEHDPDVVHFAGELAHVNDAKRISLEQLRSDISVYSNELMMLRGQVQASNDETEDQFQRVMTPFEKEAAQVVEELNREFNALENQYAELVSSFGEDPRKLGTTSFFALMDDFLSEFKKAYRENHTKDYEHTWTQAKTQAQEEAILKEEEAKAQAKEEEAKAKAKEEEVKVKAKEEEADVESEAKALYSRIMKMVSSYAQKRSKDADAVERFKAITRKFGNDEISADEFCAQVGNCIGRKRALQVIPESARLLVSDAKRLEIRDAYARFSANENTSRKTKAIKLQDIEPVVGEAAHLLHKSVLESVQLALGGDHKKMKEFTSNARKFGGESISAREYYLYLTATFDPDFVGRLVPDLARLLQDGERRHALIRALCESAPGWERFNGY
uniref:Forminhomology 2 domaincontaining protein putative n=1 Tax=Albugo laibachii Nc14 TaxID=890382 RepID=F0W7K9_9STRA|nr:forminhomology 2 domaincontaining protein putative [Albugo laibachii Nc14]|eukprot:CCA17110.1 forminhomology 2 domaincontaining protein putative [Albugo laibachii Nc14]